MENRNKNIIFHNAVKVNDVLWFWELRENALFKTKCDELCANIVHLRCYEKRKAMTPLYGKIVKFENKLIGIPLLADEILIYDYHTGMDKYIPLPDHIFDEKFVERGKFWDVVIDGEYAYLIGYWSNKLLKLDLAEEKILKIVKLDIENDLSCKDIYFKKACIFGENLIVPSCQKNVVYVMDKDSMNYKVREFEGTDDGFSSLLVDDSNIWLSPRRNGKFVRWQIKTDRVDYLDYPEGFKTARPSYGFLEKIEGDILAFPLHARGILRIHVKTLEIHIDSRLTEICGKDDAQIQKTGFTEFDGEKLTIYSWGESCFIEFDIRTCTIQKNKMKYTDAYYISLMKESLKTNGYVNESDCPLDIFIQNIDGRAQECDG